MDNVPVPAWMFVTGLILSVVYVIGIEIRQNSGGLMKKGVHILQKVCKLDYVQM